jgi:hypothetical protein
MCCTEQITNEFEFFPRMHKMLSARPNINPPIITTGVGPQGRHSIYLQPPEGGIHQFEDTHPAQAQPFSDVNANLELSEEQRQRQYCTFIDVINAANAAQVAPPPPVQQLIHSHSSAEIENIPPATPKNTAASMAKVLMDKAKSNIKKLPPKASLEETLVKLSQYVFSDTIHLFLLFKS